MFLDHFCAVAPKLPENFGFHFGGKTNIRVNVNSRPHQAPSQEQNKGPVITYCLISFGEIGLLTNEPLFPFTHISLTELWLGNDP